MASSNISHILTTRSDDNLVATFKMAQEAIASGEEVNSDVLKAAEEALTDLKRVERIANTVLKPGLEEVAGANLSSETEDRSLCHETREIFRLNSGFALDLSRGCSPTDNTPVQWNHAIKCQDTDYLNKPLSPGVYVILGESGTAKTTLAKNIASLYAMSYHKVLEPVDPGEDPRTIAVTDAEIQKAFEDSLTSSTPISIIDSLSFVSLSATGFPSMEKSINPAIFKLCLWMDILASRLGRVVFLIVNTEREDDYVFSLFRGALKGKTQGLICLTSKGRGELLRRDIDRTFMRAFEVRDITGVLSAHSQKSSSDEKSLIVIERM